MVKVIEMALFHFIYSQNNYTEYLSQKLMVTTVRKPNLSEQLYNCLKDLTEANT